MNDPFDDFENELRELVPWTSPVLVLRAEAAAEATKVRRPWRWAVAGLLIGAALGTVCASRFVEPKTIEIVRIVEVPAVAEPETVVWKQPNLIKPDAAGFELDVLIEGYNERARLMSRIAEARPVAGRVENFRLPDDPNSIYRLRETTKM